MRRCEMEADGADLIDVGGESTRPGAEPLPAAEEAARVLPVLERLRGRVRHAHLDRHIQGRGRRARPSAEGAVIVNDVSGLRYEPALGGRRRRGAARRSSLMHTRGRSRTMYQEAHYDDVVGGGRRRARESLRAAAAAGVARERVIVDPGIGFAKRPAHSYGVLARLPELAAAGSPGPGRAVAQVVHARRRQDQAGTGARLGTAAAVTAAVLAGAHIVRVHAVAEMVAGRPRGGGDSTSDHGLAPAT